MSKGKGNKPTEGATGEGATGEGATGEGAAAPRTLKGPVAKQKAGEEAPPAPAVGTKEIDIEATIARGIAEGLSKVKPQTVYVTGQEQKLPRYAANTDIGDGDMSDKPMRIVRPGRTRTFAHFLINGKVVPCPRTRLINFRRHDGAGTQMFGDGRQTNYLEVYDTYSKKEQELFMADDRMGREFYVDRGQEATTSELTLMSLFSRSKRIVDNQTPGEVREGFVRYGGKLGVPMEQMRIEVADHMAREEYKRLQHAQNLDNVEVRREKLMAGGNAR